MTLRIKDLEHATIKAFHTGNWDKCEKAAVKNDKIMKQLFEDLKVGKINAFYLKSEKTFQCWHRSTKESGKIQVSEGFYKNNELIPCCDVQLETFRDFLTEGYPPGIYETI